MNTDTLPHVAGSSTSQAAAEAIKPCAATLRQQVLDAIRAANIYGLTDEEGIAITGINPSTYRPRRIELQGNEQRGTPKLIIDLGERRKTASGRYAVVWFAVSKP